MNEAFSLLCEPRLQITFSELPGYLHKLWNNTYTTTSWETTCYLLSLISVKSRKCLSPNPYPEIPFSPTCRLFPTPRPGIAGSWALLTWVLHKGNLHGNHCLACSPASFLQNAQRTPARFICCALVCELLGSVGLPGSFVDSQLGTKSRKPGRKWTGWSQGSFPASFKAAASCPKFLMTTFLLKLPLALQEASLDNTVNQDNLSSKKTD